VKDNMQAEKLSVSLPAALLNFVEGYQATHNLASRSQVIQMALTLLQAQELEAAYRDAAAESNIADWDCTIADGLSDETW
jgi:antitoxin ParD1/3/4